MCEGRYSSSAASAPSTSSDSTAQSAARAGVRGDAAQLVQPDLDPGELGHHLRARDEGDRLRVHDDQVGQPEQQGGPGDDRAGGGQQHRYDAAAGRDRGGGLAPAVERRHAVEHIGPARRHDEHERDAQTAGQIGRFAPDATRRRR